MPIGYPHKQLELNGQVAKDKAAQDAIPWGIQQGGVGG